MLPQGVWVLDADRSEVGFEVRHLGLARVRGHFTRFTGSVEVNGETVSARGAVQVGSVETGDARRDRYLRTAPEFFDPDHHPLIEFVCGPVPVGSARSFELEGELTIRGASRPLALEVEDAARGRGGDGGANELVLRAHGELERGDYGLRFPAVAGYGDALVGEAVKIRVRALLARSASR